MAAVGSFLLAAIGFEPEGKAEVMIEIGADPEPDKARIILSWPLPEQGPATTGQGCPEAM